MPFVNVKTMKGALTEEQKSELHRKITDLMVEVEGRGNQLFRSYVMIMIEELEPQNIGMAGRQGSAEFVRKIIGSSAG